jgi:hypothetical protein
MDRIKERKDLIALEDGAVIGQKLNAAKVTEQDGNIVAIVSTPSIDSYGDVIVQGPNDKGKGWLLDRFNKAPVMLWSHNMYQMNISGPETRASVRPHEKFGEALVLEPVRFDEGDPDAVALEGKIRRKVIVENSVGFTSDKYEWIRDDENDRVTGMKFFEQELLELSWANRGANPDTTTMFKTMLATHPDLAARVDARDSQRTIEDKADLMASMRLLNERVKELENLVMKYGPVVDLVESAQAEALVRAQLERKQRIDALLHGLGK